MVISTMLLRSVICGIVVLFIGCSTIRYTQPPRTATEQFLMSYAAIEAINKMDMTPLQKREVFIDETYFESFDKKFVISQLRSNILSNGAIITDRKDETDIIVEIRSAGLGIDQKDTMLGIPSIPMPLPTGGTVATPELAIFKRIKQTGLAGIALTAYDKGSGESIYSFGPSLGKTVKTDWFILGIMLSGKKNLPNAQAK